MKTIIPGSLVVDRQRPKFNGFVLCCLNEGDTKDTTVQGLRYYVFSDGYIWSMSHDSLKVTQEGYGLSDEQKIRFSKYLNPGVQKAPQADLTNANFLPQTPIPLKSKNDVVYADSEINVSLSAYPGKYLITTKNVRIGNKINKATKAFKGYTIHEGEEPQFHLDALAMKLAIEALGERRGEKVYAALRNS